MSIEAAIVRAVCAISFSLASNGYWNSGNTAMATITGISASVAAILFVREVSK